MVKLALGVGAGLVAGTHAFWRMECPGRVGLARIDPIVNRGEASPHVHSIHGSSGELRRHHFVACSQGGRSRSGATSGPRVSVGGQMPLTPRSRLFRGRRVREPHGWLLHVVPCHARQVVVLAPHIVFQKRVDGTVRNRAPGRWHACVSLICPWRLGLDDPRGRLPSQPNDETHA